MKQLITSLLLLSLFSCDNTQQSDNEKETSETNIEISGDSGEIKISKEGISIQGDDSASIKINSKDGIKIEGKDGKVEIKTGDGGKLNVEKKGKEVNIEIKEN
ncbi:hypothetical protein [Lacibacter sp. H407]|uniref:hypothetical protein n=1 Tax=Lacibacter sp. H407 TaxID=3133423 RepID=UPI0030C2EAB3